MGYSNMSANLDAEKMRRLYHEDLPGKQGGDMKQKAEPLLLGARAHG